ncbi:hypothetical protein BI081_gp017 [Mycobacterium phage Tonenili]|uniref:Uncharacterized protein n=1 Tax=Mycobacterium phage Tonenili TaxID=1891703 RepID=A0A1C9EH04_9CAUD|nr:hypothetical protein BI081_gp017 [Mycobacterium phage Tonenili]AON96768.1 hypothetical protein SEA_TONENILI_17 [Mycobacterium phage Tonenili]
MSQSSETIVTTLGVTAIPIGSPSREILPRPYGYGAHAQFTMRMTDQGSQWALVVRDQTDLGRHRKLTMVFRTDEYERAADSARSEEK